MTADETKLLEVWRWIKRNPQGELRVLKTMRGGKPKAFIYAGRTHEFDLESEVDDD